MQGFKRFMLDGTVRLKNAFVIHCHNVIRDGEGKVVELECTFDLSSRQGAPPSTLKKPKGIIHWVPHNAEKVGIENILDKITHKGNTLYRWSCGSMTLCSA